MRANGDFKMFFLQGIHEMEPLGSIPKLYIQEDVDMYRRIIFPMSLWGYFLRLY